MQTKLRLTLLCSKNEYTKSESNSQHDVLGLWAAFHCVQRTNIQNLKAIHNWLKYHHMSHKLCSKNEYTKSESNSQLPLPARAVPEIVFKERIYKI